MRQQYPTGTDNGGDRQVEGFTATRPLVPFSQVELQQRSEFCWAKVDMLQAANILADNPLGYHLPEQEDTHGLLGVTSSAASMQLRLFGANLFTKKSFLLMDKCT